MISLPSCLQLSKQCLLPFSRTITSARANFHNKVVPTAIFFILLLVLLPRSSYPESFPTTTTTTATNTSSANVGQCDIFVDSRKMFTIPFSRRPNRRRRILPITQYFSTSLTSTQMRCDTKCEGGGRSSKKFPSTRQQRNTVVRDPEGVEALWRDLLRESPRHRQRKLGTALSSATTTSSETSLLLSSSSTPQALPLLLPLRRRGKRVKPLPWCTRFGQDIPGHWVSLTAVEEVARREVAAAVAVRSKSHQPQYPPHQLSTNGKEGKEELGQRLLQLVMSGDLSQVVRWPNVWVPSRCRMFRYNASSIYKCSKAWYHRHNSSLWLYFLGDSTSQGLFCDLLRVLQSPKPNAGGRSDGGEYFGFTPYPPCYGGIPLGANLSLAPDENFKHYRFACLPSHLRVSFHFSFGVTDKHHDRVMEVVFSPHPNKPRPTHVVYNTGFWDFLRGRTSILLPSSRNASQTKRLSSTNDEGTAAATTTTPEIDALDRSMLAARDAAVSQKLLTELASANYTGRLIFRNNPCNGNFDARAVDNGVERLLRPLRWDVMNVYPYSVCRGTELMRDKLHFDRKFSALPPRGKPNLGELSMQIVQALLNVLCNPLLLKSTTTGRTSSTKRPAREQTHRKDISSTSSTSPSLSSPAAA